MKGLLAGLVCVPGAWTFVMTGAPAAMKVEGEGPHARGHVVTATQNCRSDFLRRVALAAPLGLITATASLQRDAAIADEGSTPASAPTFRNRVTTDTEQGVTSQGGGGEWKEPRVTQKGFMDISVGEAPAERLVISLYGDKTPETVKNFVSLLSGENEGGLTYKGTQVYRVLSGLNIQMGAIGSVSGRAGKAASGTPFPQENFSIPHKTEGLLSMVKDIDGNSDSRFFINIKEDAGWADGRYVAYGRVSEGMDVVKKIDQSRVEGGSNKPSKPIVVVDCGLLPM